MSRTGVGGWLMRHRTVGGHVHRLAHRGIRSLRYAERGCWVCRAVWAWVMSDTDFADGLRRGTEDADAGRCYRWTGGKERNVPAESWKPDDPVQPDGWHHDGTAWVLNEDGGWFTDDSGFWRYNHPGDPGWHELADGSWEYVAAPGPERG